jgi:hypothetical protein
MRIPGRYAAPRTFCSYRREMRIWRHDSLQLPQQPDKVSNVNPKIYRRWSYQQSIAEMGFDFYGTVDVLICSLLRRSWCRNPVISWCSLFCFSFHSSYFGQVYLGVSEILALWMNYTICGYHLM